MTLIPSEQRNRYLRAALFLAAALYVVVYLAVVVKRIGYPYELEWMEGGSVDHVQRIVDGVPLYAPPSINFVPFIYPPLYFYASAAVAQVTGVGFLPLRIVSALASVGAMLVLFLYGRREGGGALHGMIAAGVFAASFAASGGWFDIGRVDSLFILLVLLAIYQIRFARGRLGWIAAGIVIALAYATKQTALVALGPLVLYALIVDRRRWLYLAVTAVLASVGAYLVMSALCGEWYAYYIYRVPAGHAMLWGDLLLFWTRDILPWGAVAMLLAAPFVADRLRNGIGGERWFHALLLIGMFGAAWISRLHVGGYINVVMPAHAAIALLVPAALRWWTNRLRGVDAQPASIGPDAAALARPAPLPVAESYILLVLLAQFVMWYYNPKAFVPSHADRDAAGRFIAELAAAKGEVFVADHSWLAVLAGKHSNAQSQSMLDVLRSGDTATAAAMVEQVRTAIAAKRYGLVAVDEGSVYDRVSPGNQWLTRLLDTVYGPPRILRYRSDEFYPVVGMKSRPVYIYSLSGNQPAATPRQ